jgi:hypothetical protein
MIRPYLEDEPVAFHTTVLECRDLLGGVAAPLPLRFVPSCFRMT